VESKALTKEIASVGKIDIPESNTQQITTRFGGRIERLSISYVGQFIKAGDPVAEMYSPDAIAAQREFLLALSSSDTESVQSTMAKQSRLKLKLWGFTDQQLDQLARDQKPATIITIYSHITGTIVKKNVDLQRYVAAGEALYDVADLRTVWLLLDIYDNEISLLHVGQSVEASIDALPDSRVTGRISFISPTLDPSARTTRVRVSLDNTFGTLKPEMYAHATIRVPLPKSPVVPATAVLSNGKRDIVWVQREQGHFEPRTVSLGQRCGDSYQILRGIQEGETIAVSGAYLIDSESQLQVATSGGQAR
jgi:Cu(I)/Ag(I) efflux system membrane fusion protein